MTADELAEIARRPREEWRALIEARVGAGVAADHAMMWLATELVEDPEPPSLGSAGARYELIAPLDRGGTATIWQARDRLLERTVAIKLFHDDVATTSRAIHEARAASDVVSDHVVRVLDVVDGEPSLIVMELVGEYDARGELRFGRAASEDRPRSLAEAVRWLIQIARGVHDAHLRNVFHRDLNPRNVLITPLSRRARIADFGLAASRHGHHRFGGTPAYMAPEQLGAYAMSDLAYEVATDRRASRTARDEIAVDVWGIGAIAHDLLTGRSPGERDGCRASLERALTRERIPAVLRRIVERMLAPAPEDRYPSAAEVADELAAYAAARPTTFDRSTVARAGLWCRRNSQVASAGVIALVLAVIVVGSFVTLSRLDDERELLTDELAARKADREKLIAGVEHTRSELREAEDQLATVGKSLRDEREAYVELLAAKERALQAASAERHHLLDRLENLQDDRSLAVSTGQLYERFWLSARKDADRAMRARVRLEAERDQARAELRALTAQLVELQREVARIVPPALPPEPVEGPPAPATVDPTTTDRTPRVD